MIVQMDGGRSLFPKEYKPSDKIIKIEQRVPGRTFVEYDTGVGRTGAEPFFRTP